MKVNHMGYSVSWKAFLGILLAACFLATAAHAASLFTGKFTLTNNVHWGQAVLPPGEYSFALDLMTYTITIRDAHSGKAVARVLARTDYKKGGGDSKLLISVRGRQRAVCSVQVAGLGEVYNQANPFGAHGPAAEEARNTEAIPIELAQK
jgi:hypothetical protein